MICLFLENASLESIGSDFLWERASDTTIWTSEFFSVRLHLVDVSRHPNCRSKHRGGTIFSGCSYGEAKSYNRFYMFQSSLSLKGLNDVFVTVLLTAVLLDYLMQIQLYRVRASYPGSVFISSYNSVPSFVFHIIFLLSFPASPPFSSPRI